MPLALPVMPTHSECRSDVNMDCIVHSGQLHLQSDAMLFTNLVCVLCLEEISFFFFFFFWLFDRTVYLNTGCIYPPSLLALVLPSLCLIPHLLFSLHIPALLLLLYSSVVNSSCKLASYT